MSGDARNRKSDSVASKMGEMLLKGYKMLATSCDACNNVLMQDRQGNTICVACAHSEPVATAVGRPPEMNSGMDAEAAVTAPTGQKVGLGQAIKNLRGEIVKTSAELSATMDWNTKLEMVTYMQKCAETMNVLTKRD